jgi:hypothetical protein
LDAAETDVNAKIAKGERTMSQAISVLLLALGLSLTSYLGVEAWRSTADNMPSFVGTKLPLN